MCENEIQELTTQLRQERERIFKLVEMHGQVTKEREALRSQLAAARTEASEASRKASDIETKSAWELMAKNKLSSYPRLGQFAERDLPRSAQKWKVRVIPVPATELVGLLAHAGVALPPPRLFFSIEHAVADRPCHGDLAGGSFAARLAPQRTGEDVSVCFSDAHNVSPGRDCRNDFVM